MGHLIVQGHPVPAGLPLGRFELCGERITVGRGEDADLRLRDSRISRVHLVLDCDAAGWCATDRGSANGTQVDGRPLTGTVRLRRGTVLELGPYRLRYGQDAPPSITDTVRGGPPPARLTPQETLAVTWLCEPARRGSAEFVEPSSVRSICRAMHLAQSSVEKLLNNAQAKVLGRGQPLNRTRLAAAVRASGLVTDADLASLPAPPE